MKSFSSDFKHSLNIIILYELLMTLRTHFEYEELSKRKSNEKHFDFMWKSSAIGLSPFVFTRYVAFPLTRKAALLFLSHFITTYLVWRIRNSMPSWHPGERKLHCLSWCARSSPLRTEQSGSVCESVVCRPSLTEERVLSGWKKEKGTKTVSAVTRKGKRKDFQGVSESVYEYEKGHYILASRIPFPDFHASKGFLIQ